MSLRDYFYDGKITASNTTELTFPDSLQQLIIKSTGQFKRIIIQNIVSSLRQGIFEVGSLQWIIVLHTFESLLFHCKTRFLSINGRTQRQAQRIL